ncbi:hypothetical protein [Nocardia arthritidis]|uniref:Uncharacterized protein n=1 Tax=Nocardia arthritidis TaxID=228602 RepID=A0A6G9YKX1_9NOCA|nr:hypothetical protein [Nocardia arthritidis]QIS13790.1 hypothetical protein F5544_29725 [Nocardia arthritidis]
MTPGHFIDSGQLPPFGFRATGAVAHELIRAAAGRTGALAVTGDPGGVFHLVDGRVATVRSRGAPGISELLTGRGDRPPGAAELRLLSMMTALDGTFASRPRPSNCSRAAMS